MKKFLALVIAAVMCISIFTFGSHPLKTIAQATVNENDIPVMNSNIEPIAQSVNLEGINAASIKQTNVTEYYKNQDSITNLLSTTAPAPVGTTWAKTYGGSSYEEAYFIQQTSDGGYIVVGYTNSFGAGSTEILIIKLGANGTVSWAKTYGGSSSDYANSIQQTKDNGYIVAGYTYSFGAEGTDILIIKLGADGTVDWAKTYGGSNDDYAYSIQQTSDGGYIVAGHTWSFGAGNYDLFVIKLDENGTVSWAKTYGEISNDWANSIQQTSDGYIVAGSTYSFGASVDFLVIKLDASGAVSWAKTYGGSSGDDWAYSIQQTSDGGYIVAGYTDSFGEGFYDLFVIKLDASGAVSWKKTYGGSSYDRAFSIQQTSDGGYIVAGYTNSFGAGNNDILIIKLDADGTVSWAKTYGGSSGDDWAYSIQQTSDGGYIVAGSTYSFGAGADFLVIKLNSNGEIGGSCSYLQDHTTDVAVNSWNNITEKSWTTLSTTSIADLGAEATVIPNSRTIQPNTICEGSVTVTFNYNYAGATEPYTTRYTDYNTSLGSNMPTPPTRTGYTFAGWNTNADGTGDTFTSSTLVTADITVYAQWTTNAYTVTFNYNYAGATEPYTTRSTDYNTSLGSNMPANPTRTGYTFVSWNTKADGTGVTFTSSTVVTADITVYAQWTSNTYTITASAGPGGSITPSGAVTVNYGESQSFTITANPGYLIARILVDGKPISFNNPFKYTYTFTNVKADHTITAEFMKQPDVIPPALTLLTTGGIEILSPDGLIRINTPTLTFTVQATDESGIARMVVKVNGVIQIDKNNLDPTITPSEGMNTVEVTVYDTYGNYATKSFKVLKDTQGPTIVLPPDLPQTVSSNTFTLKGTVIDNVSGISTLTVNGKPVIPTLNGSFELQLTLTQGTNIIAIVAVDKLGNKTTKTITLSYNISQSKSYIIILKVGDPHININGIEKTIDAQSSKPIIKNDRTLLPIRVIIESLGGTVEWDNTQRKVTISLGYNTIELWIGKNTAKVNGVNKPIDSTNSKVVPEIINSRTYLPIRFISENLGANVNWDSETQTITIYYWP